MESIYFKIDLKSGCYDAKDGLTENAKTFIEEHNCKIVVLDEERRHCWIAGECNILDWTQLMFDLNNFSANENCLIYLEFIQAINDKNYTYASLGIENREILGASFELSEKTFEDDEELTFWLFDH
ncbi:hypothetical protein [Clostridium sp.]|uniref:hypothetical protein n=1 Tax=Clostridium sp. TaxID=1506 RepID=UPI001B5E37A7|nr:hypothetical protein [Clostridium sp.]MBP3916606.1 hypothetical protein [Clostridium sp.]